MKNILLLTIALSFVNLFAQENCEKFKTGTFRMSDSTINFECTITRNDSLQIETVKGSNEVSVYKVAWPSACEYTLQMISGKSPDLELFKDKILRVKILATEEDNYTYEAKMDGIDLVVSETIYIID